MSREVPSLLAAVLARAQAVNKSLLALFMQRELLPEPAVIAFVHNFRQGLAAVYTDFFAGYLRSPQPNTKHQGDVSNVHRAR
jgi:hypothetical protein